MRSELVVDALEMARWRRRPAPGAIVHSDRGSESWLAQHDLSVLGLPLLVRREVAQALASRRWG
jgi:putative transposase